MTKMTVLHSFPVWLPQTQTWMYNQVADLARQGLNVHVVCERTENLDQFGVDNIHSLANESLFRQLWDKGVRRIHFRDHLQYLVDVGQKIGAQIVHSHFGNIGWGNIDAVSRLGAKHVVTFYGLDVNLLPRKYPIWRRRYQCLFDSVDRILCEGQHMADCIATLGCPPDKISVQHLGVDVQRIVFRPRNWHHGEPLKVLIAASFREKKGIPYAIEAVGMLQKEIPLELTIIGDAGQDAAGVREKQHILEIVEQMGLSKKIRWLGFLSHEAMLAEAYQNHVFISPSITAADGDTEGGAPVSLIEMTASGMPIVSTIHCDIPEIIQHGISGWLAPERDSFQLYKHMKYLVENPLEWEGMLFAGRHHVEREYDMRTQGERLHDIYAGVLGGSRLTM